MSNVELLMRALLILREDVQSLIECCSTLRQTGEDEFEPAPGTLDPDSIDDVAQRLQLVRDIEAVTGKRSIGPIWLDDMIFYGSNGRPA